MNGWKQSRSQDFTTERGGLFLKFDSTVNELDPNFHLVSIGLRQIQSVFLPKSSDLQKKSLHQIQSVFLSTDTHFYFSFHDLWGGYFRLGGAISRFRAKTNLKTAKSMLFCILFRPMGGGAIAPFAPPSYATGWKDARCSQSIFHTTSLR